MLPLTHQTILVTRAAGQSSDFGQLLQAQGATVLEMPTLEIGPPTSWEALDGAIAQLPSFDWLILTSANGVDAFFERLGSQVIPPGLKIAVVGKKTAAVLRRYGRDPDFVPPNFIADSLIATFPDPLTGRKILFPRVESGGREVLVTDFRAQGAEVMEVAAYESRCPAAIAPAVLAALQADQVQVVTFASAKTVVHFCQLLQQALGHDWGQAIALVQIASIGPQTSIACQQHLGRVDIEATQYTLEGLVAAILEALR